MQEAGITISNSDLKRLLACANGDAALLYLYLAAGNEPGCRAGAPHAEDPARPCGGKPAAAGALRAGRAEASGPRRSAQLYRRGRDARIPHEPGISEHGRRGAKRRLGRLLSTEEIKILLSIYRYLGLPPEVISILINYCIQRGRGRGQTRMPSIRSIEKEAYRWADLGVDTMEEAAVYMQSQLQVQANVGKIQQSVRHRGAQADPGRGKAHLPRGFRGGFGERESRWHMKNVHEHGRAQVAVSKLDLKELARAGLLTTLERIEAGDRPPEEPARSAAKPGYNVQHHDDALSDIQRAAIRRMLENGEE